MASPVAGLRPIRALRFCTTSLTMPGSTNSPDRFNSFSDERRQLIKELACLRPLHFETIGKVREQLRLAHAAGLCHCVPRSMRATIEPRCSGARLSLQRKVLEKSGQCYRARNRVSTKRRAQSRDFGLK